MEKGELLSSAHQITHRAHGYENSPLFDIDDKRLLQILQVPNYEGFHYSKSKKKVSTDFSNDANDNLFFDFGFQDSRKVLDFKKLKKNLSKESIDQLDKIDKLRNDDKYEISGNEEFLDYITHTDLTKEIIDILVKFGDKDVRRKMVNQKKYIRLVFGKHKDKVNLIRRADFARVLANRGKSADYIKTNNDTVNAYFDTASKNKSSL
ncbi:hypothetical protein KUM_0508 [Taylorella asinigenitalis 14/45]|uniref:Uncharacterized protein n=1 Tax=Taylorella asinigenitalis 14/45 TaxID=1091495 RepID=I7JR92_9BURK|nr:hypothetical protein [Taylorella asinigenitalis]CCG19305.1 hypothetical protein KUM_0508 [Taylorella asinigenitalis 14/45]